MLEPLSRSPVVPLFDDLVRSGEKRANTPLPFALHQFLVYVLVDHLREVKLLYAEFAVPFLSWPEKRGGVEVKVVHLRRLGDAALLHAGLFPERAYRLNVSDTYFAEMGEMAYASLAALLSGNGRREPGSFFSAVARGFGQLALVLSATREKRYHDDWATLIERARGRR